MSALLTNLYLSEDLGVRALDLPFSLGSNAATTVLVLTYLSDG
jgi:hypothetical protein